MTYTKKEVSRQADVDLLKEDLKVVEFEIKQSRNMECRIALIKLSGIIDADIKQLRRKKQNAN